VAGVDGVSGRLSRVTSDKTEIRTGDCEDSSAVVCIGIEAMLHRTACCLLVDDGLIYRMVVVDCGVECLSFKFYCYGLIDYRIAWKRFDGAMIYEFKKKRILTRC
jgi:hypothetical protein